MLDLRPRCSARVSRRPDLWPESDRRRPRQQHAHHSVALRWICRRRRALTMPRKPYAGPGSPFSALDRR